MQADAESRDVYQNISSVSREDSKSNAVDCLYANTNMSDTAINLNPRSKHSGYNSGPSGLSSSNNPFNVSSFDNSYNKINPNCSSSNGNSIANRSNDASFSSPNISNSSMSPSSRRSIESSKYLADNSGSSDNSRSFQNNNVINESPSLNIHQKSKIDDQPDNKSQSYMSESCHQNSSSSNLFHSLNYNTNNHRIGGSVSNLSRVGYNAATSQHLDRSASINGPSNHNTSNIITTSSSNHNLLHSSSIHHHSNPTGSSNQNNLQRSDYLLDSEDPHMTPSPSDSGVAELEAILKEKDTEICQLKENMDRSEQIISKVDD